MEKRLLALAVVVLLLCALFSGCKHEPETTVSVQSVGLITGMGSVGLNDRYAGIVVAGQTVGVEKDSDMQIREMLVAVGDNVTEGQVLFTYDTEAISLELDKKRLELEQLKATLSTKTAQKEELEKQREKAKQEDQLDYTLQIQELEIDITETGMNITAKEREIARTEAYLENDKVTSPVSGRIQTVNQNGSTDEYGNPQPFITIAETSVYRVKGTINEQNAAALGVGIPVTVRSRAEEDRTWSGSVDYVDWENPVQNNNYYWDMGGDSEMTQSSKYPFYVNLDSDEGLLIGQHVYIEPGEDAVAGEGLWLPAWCINDADTDHPWVWAVDKKEKLEKRSITLDGYDEFTDTYLVVAGLSLKDYIAPPGEDCKVGASVVYYSEEDFEPPMNPEGGFEEGNYGFEEGGFYEGGDGFEEGGFYEGGDGFEEGGFYEGDYGFEEGGFYQEEGEDYETDPGYGIDGEEGPAG